MKGSLIGISGKFGAGKDTVAAMIIAWAKIHTKHTFTIHRFAYRLKKMVSIMTNTSEEQNFSREGKQIIPRGFNDTLGTLQQKLGMAMRQAVDVNVWVDSVFANISPGQRVLITDVRFPNEFDRIRAEGGIIIRIEGGPPLAPDGRDPMHPSECALDNHIFDAVIENNGTLDDLHVSVDHLLNSLNIT